MATSTNEVTIDETLDRFLADQRERLSEKTFRRYEDVVRLLRHSLDGYAYSWLDENERQRWEKEFETNEEGAFCRLFGPEKIPDHLGAFLGDFMSARCSPASSCSRPPAPPPASSSAGSHSTATSTTRPHRTPASRRATPHATSRRPTASG